MIHHGHGGRDGDLSDQRVAEGRVTLKDPSRTTPMRGSEDAPHLSQDHVGPSRIRQASQPRPSAMADEYAYLPA